MSASNTPVETDLLRQTGSTYLPPRPGRRRDKPQLSCSSCKQRKLKCDRKSPCETCVKRGQAATCFYVPFTGKPSASSQASPASNGAIQAKIRDLESMVVSLMRAQKEKVNDDSDGVDDSYVDVTGPESVNTDDSLTEAYGRIDLENSNTRYVDGSHWTAILDGITELKDHFEDAQTPDSSGTSEATVPDHVRPNLMFNTRKRMTRDEILKAIPERSIVDRLVSKWFTELEMQPGVIHPPTFIKEYDLFWKDQGAPSVTWLGLLFSILCGSAQYQALFGGEVQLLSSSYKTFQEMADEYRELVAQCLIYADYTNPGEYTVETLIMYYSNEHFRSRDGQFGNFLLLSMIVRVAMRMGYHRDASHYKNISVFQGELRRRVWATIVQLDLSASAQMGLPRMIQDFHWDTAPPRNILDSDFDENSTSLPESKPDNMNTTMSYTRIKFSSIRILGKIGDIISATKPVPYSRILKLEEELQRAQEIVPAVFRYRSITQSLADTPSMILRRYYLDLNFQKARCLLHQRYAVQARHDNHFQGSRKACLEAAMRLLQHQLVFYQETRPGGRLHFEKWKMSSFLSTDYFLAATIICVDLDHQLEHGQTEEANNTGLTWSREEMIQALSDAHQIWLISGQSSAEACKAALALGIMLQKLRRSSSLEPEAQPQAALVEFQAMKPHLEHSELETMFSAPKYGGTEQEGSISASFIQPQTQMFQGGASVYQQSPSMTNIPTTFWHTPAQALDYSSSYIINPMMDYNAINQTKGLGGLDSMMDMPMQPQWDLWNNNMNLMELDQNQGEERGYTPDWTWDGYQEAYTDDGTKDL